MRLVVGGLSVFYGSVEAVHAISMTVEPRMITTIIGANGAGKTTIMKAIAGLLPGARGEIHYDGVDLLKTPAHDIVGLGGALVPEGRRLFASMTVRENLMVGAYRRTDAAAVRRDFERVLAHLPALQERLSAPARILSGGQQQMLSVGRALMSNPRLLMLDEPTVGLSPQMVHRIGEIIKAVSLEGVDILLVEQNANLALALAGYGYVLETGSIVLEGLTARLRDDPAVRQTYLGLTDERPEKPPLEERP